MVRRAGFEIAIALVVGAVLGSCVHALGARAAAPPQPATEVAAARLERVGDVSDHAVALAGTAVVPIEVETCGEHRQATATALLHAGRTVVLTNAHVVRGAGSVWVLDAEGRRSATVAVSGAVEGRDAAVLRAADWIEAAPTVPVEMGQPVEVGQPVVVVGHPGGVARARSGTVTGIERRAGFGGAGDVLLLDVPVSGGDSGGAVLDDVGRVLGLVAAKDPSTGGAVAYPIAEVLGRRSVSVPSC